MPTPTYDLIASNVLTTNPTSVTFSSIPATYRDLVLVCRYTTSSFANLGVVANADYTSYPNVGMAGNGSSTFSYTGNTEGFNSGEYAVSTSNEPTLTVFNIMDYSATDKHKTCIARTSNAARAVEAVASRWANTSAINSLTIETVGSPTLQSGSTFYLYGIVS